MTLEIHTDYDVAHLEDLQRVISKAVDATMAQSVKRIDITFGVLMLLAGAVLMLAMKRILAVGVVLAVIGVVFINQGLHYNQHAAKNTRKKMNPAFTGNDYILDELGIRVENALGVMEYKYEDCNRLLETQQNIYMMLNDGQGLILDKNNIEGGSVADLRSCLEQNCGKELEQVDVSGK